MTPVWGKADEFCKLVDHHGPVGRAPVAVPTAIPRPVKTNSKAALQATRKGWTALALMAYVARS